jgi:hypothetical protein
MRERGLVAVNPKNQAVFGVDRNSLIKSILIQVFACTNLPSCSCAKNWAAKHANEPIAAAHKAIMQCAMIDL